MSYEILYAKKFIRLPNNSFIPLILSGSNNCSMFVNGKEIRERHWWILGKLIAKKEKDMLEWICNFDCDEWFKVGSNWISGQNDMIKFIKNSCKNASTIEEILEANRFVSFSASISIYDSTKSYGEKGWERRVNEKYLKTTDEIMEWIKEGKEIERNLNENETLYWNMEFATIKPLKSNSISKSSTGPVICSPKRGWYISEYTDRGYTYCSDIEKAIIFESVESFKESGLAERIHGGYKLINGVVKPKDYVILVTEGFYSGCYIQKLTSKNLHFTRSIESAKRFEREKEALDYIEKMLKGRCKHATKFDVINTKNSEAACM